MFPLNGKTKLFMRLCLLTVSPKGMIMHAVTGALPHWIAQICRVETVLCIVIVGIYIGWPSPLIDVSTSI